MNLRWGRLTLLYGARDPARLSDSGRVVYTVGWRTGTMLLSLLLPVAPLPCMDNQGTLCQDKAGYVLLGRGSQVNRVVLQPGAEACGAGLSRQLLSSAKGRNGVEGVHCTAIAPPSLPRWPRCCGLWYFLCPELEYLVPNTWD